MGKLSFGLLLVFIFGAVIVTEAFSDEDVRRFVDHIPIEDRKDVLRYAIIRGYELTERTPSGMDIPDVNIVIGPRMLKSIYTYYLINHPAPGVSNYPYPIDIICFPSGCIEIDDPGIHP